MLAEVWQFDQQHSQVLFHTRRAVHGRLHGLLGAISGTVVLRRPGRAGRGTVLVDGRGVTTGSAHWDEYLRSDEVLDVANHPHLVFEGRVAARIGRLWELPGTATVRGIRRPVALRVRHEGRTGSSQAPAWFLSGACELDLADFGVRRWDGSGVSLVTVAFDVLLVPEGSR